MMRLSKRLEKFPEYVFSRLNKQVKEVEARTGKKVLNFGPGSPDVPPSAIYTDYLKTRLTAGDAHKYPGYAAIPEFTSGVQGWYQRRHGVQLSENEILAASGAKDGITALTLAVLDAGDEVLIPDPGYQGYPGPALLIGAKPVFYDLLENDGFAIDFADLESKITPKTKMIWANFPSNPTGAMISRTDLARLVRLTRKHKIVLAYDHAYSEIVFTKQPSPSVLEIPAAREVAVELNSFSKTFSFAGYRIGYAVGNPDIIAAMAKIKSQLDSGIFKPIQEMAAFALQHPDAGWQHQMLRSYKQRRDRIAQLLTSLGMQFELPQGALYIWAKIPDEYASAESYCEELLQKRQILFVPGTAFGHNGKRYVRVSICVNIDEIDKY